MSPNSSGPRAQLAALAMLLAAGACVAPVQQASATPAARPLLASPTAEEDTGEQMVPAEPSPPPQPTFNPAAANLRLERVVTGVRSPLGLANAGDGSNRLFVVEKEGRLRVIQNGALVGAPFIDITSLVGSSSSEQGLLGVAFHPSYETNGFFFVNYTDKSGDTVVARYQVTGNANVADPASARVILQIDQPYANHNGGNLAFGPDGYLYIGMGDGGSAGDPQNRAQNGQQLLGKMLRIDIDSGDPYAIPGDNPFVGNPSFRPEVWAYGLRNPWRYSFDRATGDLYIADVGQNQWEEIHVAGAGSGGQNYGWPSMEGAHCYRAGCSQEGYEWPIGEYEHALGCSVTGGYVYRGTAQPALANAYYFGDYCSGRIWSLHWAAEGHWVQTELAKPSVQISSFGEDEQGELYITGLGDGTVYRLVGG